MRQLLIIFAFTLLALWPFFRKGYFESHDGEWMVIRFSAFHQTLRSGQFPVRFVDRLNNNYGYPVLNFLYPLPFYFSEIPKVFGLGFVNSIKLAFVVSTLVSVFAMYFALREIFSESASLTGALLYLFVPYRFVDLYVRGSLGEVFAFAFVPMILLAIFKIKKGNKIFFPILALFVAGLITSHNVIVILFLPLFFAISLIIAKKDILIILAMFILGAGISSFFWFPALFDLQYVRLSHLMMSNIGDHLVDVSRLIIPSWGFGPNPEGFGSFSPQIGLVSLSVFLAAIFSQIFLKRDYLIQCLILVFISIIVLLLKVSFPFWRSIPFIETIQFPWRLLSVEMFLSAFFAAYIVDISEKKTLLSSVLILAAVISTILYIRPVKFVERGEGFYATNEDSTTVRDEYLPNWVKEKASSRADQKISVEGGVEIQEEVIRPVSYFARISAQEDSKIRVNTIYFPGFQALVDNSRVPIDYNNRFGLINFILPKGDHEIIIRYARSPIHLISEIASLAAIFITGIYFFIIWRKKSF